MSKGGESMKTKRANYTALLKLKTGDIKTLGIIANDDEDALEVAKMYASKLDAIACIEKGYKQVWA